MEHLCEAAGAECRHEVRAVHLNSTRSNLQQPSKRFGEQSMERVPQNLDLAHCRLFENDFLMWYSFSAAARTNDYIGAGDGCEPRILGQRLYQEIDCALALARTCDR